jgi:hypothetical protein
MLRHEKMSVANINIIHLRKGYFIKCKDQHNEVFEYIFSNLESKAYAEEITLITTFQVYSTRNTKVISEGSISKGTYKVWLHPIYFIERLAIKKKDITREIIEKTFGITSKDWDILNRHGMFGKRLVECFYRTIVEIDKSYIDEKDIDLDLNPTIYVYKFKVLKDEKSSRYSQTLLFTPKKPKPIDFYVMLKAISEYRGLVWVATEDLAIFINKQTGYSKLTIIDYLEKLVEKGLLIPLGDNYYIVFDKVKTALEQYTKEKEITKKQKKKK